MTRWTRNISNELKTKCVEKCTKTCKLPRYKEGCGSTWNAFLSSSNPLSNLEAVVPPYSVGVKKVKEEDRKYGMINCTKIKLCQSSMQQNRQNKEKRHGPLFVY